MKTTLAVWDNEVHTSEGGMNSAVRSSILGLPDSRIQEGNNTPARRLRTLPALGFVVTDAALRPVSANHEAIAILNYPGKNGHALGLAEAFEKKLRSNLLHRQGPLGAAPAAVQFKSGRRTYFCRAFLLDGTRSASGSPAMLIVLERGLSESMALSQISEQFRLTRREQEVVMLLLEGLSNKEMAERMAITANTVKALLRLVMVKMHVTSRAAVAATVLGLISSPSNGKNYLAARARHTTSSAGEAR